MVTRTLTRRGLLLRGLAATGAVGLLVAVRAAPLAFAAQPGDADHTRSKRPRLLTEPPAPRRDRRDRRDRGGLGAPPVQLARVAGVSKFHFARSFEATYGETPIRYLTRRPVERAQDLFTSSPPSGRRAPAPHLPDMEKDYLASQRRSRATARRAGTAGRPRPRQPARPRAAGARAPRPASRR